jgi:hypothetical protein
MMPGKAIPINILAEDSLCEYLARRLISLNIEKFSVGVSYLGHGFGYIQNNIQGFNNASRGIPIIAITDLVEECPAMQVQRWLPHGINRNFLFRIAVKESEAWILADKIGVSKFLGIRKELIPDNVDNIGDPKQFLVNLAKGSRYKELRGALVPRPNTTAKIGPEYNSRLSEFVENLWNPDRASQNSHSLTKAIVRIMNFDPLVEFENL